MSEKICEDCRGTGYYGDNGPGIRGNDEYQECECRKGVAVKHVREMNEQELRQRIAALERELAEAKAETDRWASELVQSSSLASVLSAERDRLRKGGCVKPASELSDDELFDELREQVNRSRNGVGHDRRRTREIAAEAARRQWKLHAPNHPDL